MDFRPAMQALELRLRTDLATRVATVTRRYLPASAFEKQPAIMLQALRVEPRGGSGATPLHHALDVLLTLYSRIEGEDDAPDDNVLDLIAAVEDALAWRTGESESGGVWTTLGGVVQWAKLEEIAIEDDFDPEQLSTKMIISMLLR